MTYLLLLGGNLGNVAQTFGKAIELLKELGTIKQKSSLYTSKAWGFEANEMFLNQVVEIDSTLEPHTMLSTTQNMEQQLGRTSKSTCEEYQSRIIDIDILFCDNLIIKTPTLTIPHPLLHKRMFTLAPLTEHWSNYMHPILQKTIEQITNECTDKSIVNRLD